jgi:hypothetical protein
LNWSGGTATPYIPASTVNLNALTMNSTSWNNLSVNIVGTGTITSNGNTSLNNFVINNPGEIVSLADNFGVSAITTLTSGTLNLNNFNLTTGGAFVSNNANVRQIQFGTGQIICNGTVSALDMANATNFTWTGTGKFSSNTAQNRTFTFGTTGGTSTNAPSLSLISGANQATLTSGSWFNILDFTGCTGGFTTVTSLNLNSLILDIGGTYTGITATMRGTGTITPNGKTLAALTINSSGTATLAGALIISGATTSTLGTLALDVYNLTSGSFASTGSLTRSITGTNSIFTITGSGATAWSNASATGWTCSGITISMTSASAKTFVGASATYPILSQGGAGALTITGSNTFGDITDTVQPCTITFTAATTTTVSAFSLSGTAGNLVTINSSISGTRFNLVKTVGVINTDYLSIQDSFAKGASAYAGLNSTNVSNNLGWTFSSWQPGNFLNFFDYNTSFNYYTDPGQIEWTTPGTYTWTVHEGVTSVSVVCVGGGGGGKSTGNQGGGAGGGLGWKNVSVTPGQVITVVVGAGGNGAGVAPTAGGNSYFLDMSTVYGGGGAAGDGGFSDFLSAGGTFLGDGGGNGGQGGYAAQGEGGGGGGAGGYAGNGGTGGWQPQTTQYRASFTGVAGSGGGGGGGGGKYIGVGYGAGGGGVGIYGQGNNGAAGQQDRDPDGTSRAGGHTAGGGGSGGQTGFIGSAYSNGGLYGGGGGGGQSLGGGTRGKGAGGAVRIIWGTNRSYPSTNTGDV